jgi:putative DNA methylase
MTQPKKLIEVAMPIKEISAESVRDGHIQNGHISSLHKWWARRPLPVCRAVVFASLVPDPLDEHCPQAFRDAIEILLGKANNFNDPYHPYLDIPWTSVFDPMEDNLRNRLQMFIGKFTEDMQQHLLYQKNKPASKNQLTDYSLIKWDNKNNEEIIGKARKLIWVAHNSKTSVELTANDLLANFDTHYQAIKTAEEKLYSLTNRHVETVESKQLTTNLQFAIDAFLDKMPKVFDPFAGGGAIPLEAARLGCKSYGNDINPVAHIIQKGSLEFPQKYGKPITYTKEEFIKLYGKVTWDQQPNEILVYDNGEPIAVNIANRLSFDVDFYAKKILTETEKEIGNLFPSDKNDNKPIAYYWARTASCSNPSCNATIPLLRQFYLCNTKSKQVYLNPIIKDKHINFEIQKGECQTKGWISRGNLFCPICNSITDVKLIKEQSINNKLKQRLLAVIIDGKKGKEYREPTKLEEDILQMIPNDLDFPTELMQRNSAGGDTFSWGITKWGQLFSDRQLHSILSIINKLNEIKNHLLSEKLSYEKATITFLGIWLNRMVARMTQFGLIDIGRETIVDLFGRQAIPMVFDYPELYPFGIDQISWIVKYIESESLNTFETKCINASSGEKSQFQDKYLTAVVTDPPYYDAIAYADLSDFFYVWFKRTLGDVYPLNFATPQTPKTEECTALKHHHNGNANTAKEHFETKLLQIFDAIEHQTSDLVSIMFAHQSTEAWTTLCNSILGARMNITGSWATDTEMTGALKTDKAFLSSSVTVSCKPIDKLPMANFKTIEKEIRQKVEEEVELLYSLGFRGADLLTACFGQAVSVFGNYQKVETAAGEEVSVAKLLEIAKEAAFNALLKGFDGDDFTKFYIGWLQLYGFAESDFDDAAKFSRVGLTINVAELFTEHILIKNGNKQTLGTFAERIQLKEHLGEKPTDSLIDQVHHAMALYKGTNRTLLLQFISKVASQPEGSFWRVVTAISEVLPNGSDDYKQAIGLNANKDSLIRESKENKTPITEQSKLDF